jgi:hypothetical protein
MRSRAFVLCLRERKVAMARNLEQILEALPTERRAVVEQRAAELAEAGKAGKRENSGSGKGREAKKAGKRKKLEH